MMKFRASSLPGLAVLLMASSQAAFAQQCPPHAHARVISIPGNLQTAHCWCDDGYENVGGVCVRAVAPTRRVNPATARDR
jgi:hypothetical protein